MLTPKRPFQFSNDAAVAGWRGPKGAGSKVTGGQVVNPKKRCLINKNSNQSTKAERRQEAQKDLTRAE